MPRPNAQDPEWERIAHERSVSVEARGGHSMYLLNTKYEDTGQSTSLSGLSCRKTPTYCLTQSLG